MKNEEPKNLIISTESVPFLAYILAELRKLATTRDEINLVWRAFKLLKSDIAEINDTLQDINKYLDVVDPKALRSHRKSLDRSLQEFKASAATHIEFLQETSVSLHEATTALTEAKEAQVGTMKRGQAVRESYNKGYQDALKRHGIVYEEGTQPWLYDLSQIPSTGFADRNKDKES